uniref:EGF-like domain-containing protein n=1 Tax=Electrophorus electricus TaxID=8005 RepID=A0AAY5ECC2_ELEEL
IFHLIFTMPLWLLFVHPFILLLFEGEACKSNLCENGGICLLLLSKEAYTWKCRSGFTGPCCAGNMVSVCPVEELVSWSGTLTQSFIVALVSPTCEGINDVQIT